MKRDSNTTATGARIAHLVEISDLDAGTRYVAKWEKECNDDTDKSAYREAVRLNDVITMGKIVARPLHVGSVLTEKSSRD